MRQPRTAFTTMPWRVGKSTEDQELRMSVLYKDNGLFGRAYTAGIAQSCRLIVYPVLVKQWERAGRDRSGVRR